MMSRNRSVAVGMTALAASWIVCTTIQARHKPLWFDEIFTVWIARKSPREILDALRFDSGPPLFYFLAKPFVALGERLGDDRILRLLSILAIASLFLLACQRKAMSGARFVLLLATSPLLFFYSAEGRSYATLSVASFVLFLATTRPGSSRSSILPAAVASAALMELHYLGVFVVGGAILAALAGRRPLRAVASAGGALFAVPWVGVALAQPGASMSWSQERLGPSLARTLGQFGFWAPAPGYFSSATLPIPAAGTLLGASIVVLTAFALKRRPHLRPAALFVLFPLVAAALATLWRPVYFSGRTEMAIWPAALWLIARASRVSAPLRAAVRLVAAAGAAVIVLSLTQPPLTSLPVRNARNVMEIHPPATLVAAADADYLPLRLAADRGRLGAALVGLPGDLASHPGWFVPLSSAKAGQEARTLARRIEDLPASSTAAVLFPSDPVLARALSAAILAPRRPNIRLEIRGDVLLVRN